MMPSSILDAAASPPNPVLYALDACDGVGQGLVLVLLLLFILALSLAIEKALALGQARRQAAQMLARCRQTRWPLALAPHLAELSGPLLPVYKAGMDTVVTILRLDDRDFELCARQRTLPRPLTDTEMASVRNAMEQAAGIQTAFLERRLTLLGVIVTTSPLLGLFGTAWGILVAFCAVADKGHATLAALVPGISGALLATLAGLVVAIPAAAAYNLLVRQVQLIGTDLAAFMDDLLDGLRRTEDN